MTFGIGLTIGKLTLAKQVTFTHRVRENKVYSHIYLSLTYLFIQLYLGFQKLNYHLIYIYIQIYIAIRKLDFRILILYFNLEIKFRSFE